MKIGPRTQLVLIASIFLLPIVASVTAYKYGHRLPTANHGELLLPPAQVSGRTFTAADGRPFSFASLRGRWVLVAVDSGGCPADCQSKLLRVRQVWLALGRDAVRVARVLVIEDGRAPQAGVLAPFEGTETVLATGGEPFAPGTSGDRSHVYLVDPHGNVMMRWLAASDPKGMLLDLQRLLKASQIG